MISREEKNKEVVKELQKEKTMEISKKIFTIVTIIFSITFLLFAYMYFVGTKGLQTKEYVIKDSNIPKSFHGVKIVHFSDLLYGNSINKQYLDKLQNEIKKINPNIVFFTGNLISKEYQATDDDIKNIKSFLKNIPYTIGKYAIKGDKDTNTFDLIFDNTNFTILNNETVGAYNNNQECINIIGLNNNSTKVDVNGIEAYTITLINNYDNFERFNVFSNLIFAGYNLGGEIRLFNIPLIKKSKFNNNYYEKNNTKIYISSGIGSIHHLRLMNHPSINVYRLYNK